MQSLERPPWQTPAPGQWWYAKDSLMEGPVSGDYIVELIEGGSITRNTVLRCFGGWIKAGLAFPEAGWWGGSDE